MPDSRSPPPAVARKSRKSAASRRRARDETDDDAILRTILDTVAVGVAHLQDRRFVWVNPAFCRIFGATQSAIRGLSTESFYPSRDEYEEFGRIAYPCLARGEVFQTDRQLRKADGELRWVRMIGRAVDPADSSAGSIWTLEDIHDYRHAQNALRDSEARWQFALEGAGDGLWDWDARTNKVYFSRRWKEMLGFGEHEVGDDLSEWESRVHPEDAPAVQRDLDRHFRGETPVYENEHRVRCKDGSYKWILDRGKAVTRDADGHPLRVIGTHVDIDLRKQLEHALLESEARYRSLIESLPDMVYSFVPETGGRYYSPQVEKVFGVSPEELCRRGMHWHDSIHPDDKPRVDALVESSHAGYAFEVEYRIRDRHGQWRWLRDRSRTRIDDQGRLVLDGIATDITATKEAELALRERDELLKKLSERVPGVIYQFRMGNDGKINIPYVSDGSRNVFGVEPGAVQERAEELLRRVHADDEERVMNSIRESYIGLTPWRCEFRGEHPQRGIRWLQGESLPERLEDGSVLWHGYINDVTERKQAEQSLVASERRYRALFDANPSPMWIYDVDTLRFIEVNAAAVAHYGYSREEFRRMTIKDIRPPEDVPRLEANIASLNDDGVERAGVWRHLKKSGETLQVEIQSTLVDFGGRRAEVVVAQDVTERVRAEEELRLAAKVFESSRQAIMITDSQPAILRVNRAFEEITGYREQEALGRNPNMLSSGRQDARFYQALWERLSEEGFWEGELWNKRKGGELYPQYLSISEVTNDAGDVDNYVALFSDISERKAAEERIQFLAHHDALTGLPNRVLLHDRVDVALAHARRENRRLALLYLDLDRFKLINDSLGHEVGDELLRQAANRIASAVRAADTVCRQGGDEFIVLLSELDEVQDAGRVAEKLIEEISRSFAVRGHELLVTLSVGIAAYPENGENLETLQRNGDSAMYAAKEAGRNTYRYYSPEMNARALERLSMERDLRLAMEREELFLVCQPQVRLRDERLVGYEVLVRWNHPQLGLVQPGRFIQVAEESGLIVQMGSWILRQACRQRRRFALAGLLDIPVAVNVSASQFGRPDFVEVVAGILESEALAPSLLELEVTEGVIMQGTDAVLETLRRLDGMGIRLSIDDFGIGYSSLSYLKQFPVKKLKIDQSFVRDLPADEGGAGITQAIIGLGRTLNMTVIAEGVETLEQAEFLRRHGCEEAQGFYFSRPVVAEAFLETAMQWNLKA